MKLTRSNLKEWLAELDEIMKEVYPKGIGGKSTYKPYSSCLTKWQWHIGYLGRDTEEVKEDEIHYMSQN